MPERTRTSRSRIISVTAVLLPCLSVSSVMSRPTALNALLGSKPSVELQASRTSITYPCPPCFHSMFDSCPSNIDLRIALTSRAKGVTKHALYVYTVNAGRVVGEGSNVIWDLADAGPGVYSASVEVHDGNKRGASSPVAVTIAICPDCVDSCLCPTLAVTCYDHVKAGTPITCKAAIVGAALNQFTYQWSARDSDGNDLTAIISKQGEYVSIPTKGLGGKAVVTTVEVEGIDPSCDRTASGVTVVKP